MPEEVSLLSLVCTAHGSVGINSLILQIRKLRLRKVSGWPEGTDAASGGARLRPSSFKH